MQNLILSCVLRPWMNMRKCGMFLLIEIMENCAGMYAVMSSQSWSLFVFIVMPGIVVSEFEGLKRYIFASVDLFVSLPSGSIPSNGLSNAENDSDKNTNGHQPSHPSPPPLEEIWVEKHENGYGSLDPWFLVRVIRKQALPHQLFRKGTRGTGDITLQAEIRHCPLPRVVIRILNVAPPP